MNVCTFTGSLGRDWEIRYSHDGKAIAKTSMAVKNRKDTTWINLTAFGKAAETMAQYTAKGSQLSVSTRFDEGKYEKDGQTKYFPQFIVDQFTFCGAKPESQPSQQNYGGNTGGYSAPPSNHGMNQRGYNDPAEDD